MIKNSNGQNIRFGVLMLGFNNADFFPSTIRIIQPFCDKILVSSTRKSWFGNIPNNGKVENAMLPLMKEFSNVDYTEGSWRTEEDQRNFCLEKFPEYDYIFIIDSDEMWTSENFKKVQSYVLDNSGYDVFMINWNTRFKNINWIVEPQESFKPIVVIKNGIKFAKNRLVNPTMEISNILIPKNIAVLEHFSYVRVENKDIKEKIQTFSHANEIINGADFFYENVFLQADLDSKNLHPTSPSAYDHLVECPIPSEIKQTLKKYSYKLFENEK